MHTRHEDIIILRNPVDGHYSGFFFFYIYVIVTRTELEIYTQHFKKRGIH